MTLAWLLLAVTVSLSLLLAGQWRTEARAQEQSAFRNEAAGIGATVTTALLRMDDLTVAARARIAAHPTLTNGELAFWYRTMDAQQRYRGTLGFGYAELVRAADLPAYVAAVRRDPIPGLPAPGGAFRIDPPGARASYCLIRLGVAAGLNQVIPGGYSLDICAVPGAGSLAASRDSGRFETLAGKLASTGKQILIASAPVYLGGGVPATVLERRARMLGWAIGVFDIDSVLGGAVANHRGVSVQIERRTGDGRAGARPSDTSLATVAHVGSTPRASALSRQFVVQADGTWVVTVTKPPTLGLASPGAQAAIVLAAGLLVSGLLFVLVRVLAGSRARALRMVADKTDELRHQALHDALTDLPNRALILDRTQQALVRSRREGTAPAALFIDLDNFKSVNDTFGHPAGDELLRAVAARVAAVLREGDTVGRLGGDEFVVLVERSGAAYPELVAERLLQVLREPYELGSVDAPLSVTASIGLVVGDRPSADDLLRDADVALYEAKAAGRDRWVAFREEMQVAVQDRLALERDLREALRRGQLYLLYQPVFDLHDDSVTGLEALLRWEHPDRGTLLPDQFVPIAEDTGLIVEIGRWALERACRQGAAWRAAGHDVEIAVNVSARQLAEPAFAASVADALAGSGLEPGALVLEITETMLMQDADETAARLRELKHLGVRIAIDDFGTGYSSLAYLQRFPVDALKIDRAFISQIARSPEAKALINTFVQLGVTLGLETVAEGIENDAQLDHLRSAECGSGQGFLLARPLTAVRAASFLARRDAA